MPAINGRPGEVDRYQILSDAQVYFDISAFDEAIASHSVSMVHWRALACPGGKTDLDDIRTPDTCHLGCSNGFLYVMAGVVQCVFTGNSSSQNVQELGVMDGSSVSVTLARCYNDGTPVRIANFDRLFLAEESVVVPEWQLVAYHQSGEDRLRRAPVVGTVLDLIDSAGIAYHEGVEFEVRNSGITWISQNRPGVDPETGKGKIYAIRYCYRPYWYISHISHQARVAVAEVGGEIKTIMLPSSVTLQREYVFEGSSQKDEVAKHSESWRQARGPQNGQFGPR